MTGRRSRICWRRPPPPPIGRSARWPGRQGFRPRRVGESGRRPGCNRIGRKRSNCPAARRSWTRRGTLWGSIWRRRTALALCLDEKNRGQAIDREQPVLPMMPGMPERRTHAYVRHGTTLPFAALDAATGFVIGKWDKRHRTREFLDFLKEIDAHVPEDRQCNRESWRSVRRRRGRRRVRRRPGKSARRLDSRSGPAEAPSKRSRPRSIRRAVRRRGGRPAPRRRKRRAGKAARCGFGCRLSCRRRSRRCWRWPRNPRSSGRC